MAALRGQPMYEWRGAWLSILLLKHFMEPGPCGILDGNQLKRTHDTDPASEKLRVRLWGGRDRCGIHIGKEEHRIDRRNQNHSAAILVNESFENLQFQLAVRLVVYVEVEIVEYHHVFARISFHLLFRLNAEIA